MNKTFVQRFATALFAVAFVFQTAHAGEDPCKDIKRIDGTLEQKPSYCAAREQAQKAARASQTSAMIWTGVAVTCAAGCFFAAGGKACSYAQMAGGATDALLAKDLMGGMMGVLGGYMTMENSKKKEAACIATATSMMSAYSKYNAANQQRSMANQFNNNAAGLDGDTLNLPGALKQNPNYPVGGNNNSDFNSTTQAALAQDPSLPGFINSDAFKKDFQKAAGVPLEDFMKVEKSPTEAFLGAMGGTLSSSQTEKMNELLSAYEKKSAQDSTAVAGQYSNGGGAGGGDLAFPEFDANDMLAKLMNQGAEEKAAEGNVQAMNLSQKRSPAMSADDPRVSIFERVSRKYKNWTTDTFKN